MNLNIETTSMSSGACFRCSEPQEEITMSYAFGGSASKRPLVKSRQVSVSDCLHVACVVASFAFVAAAVLLL